MLAFFSYSLPLKDSWVRVPLGGFLFQDGARELKFDIIKDNSGRREIDGDD